MRWSFANMPRWRWSWLMAAVAVVAIGAALVWAFAPQPVEVELGMAEVHPFEETVEDDGRARVRERVAVTMPWAGELERPLVKEGHWVAEGEPLFWVRPIQPTLLDARTRADLEARGAAAQAGWQRAARQSEVALVAWQRAAVAAARAVTLAEQGFISNAQLEAVVLDLQRDERTWQAAQAAERAALHELEQVRVALAPASALPGVARRAVKLPARVQVLRVAQPHLAVLPAGAVVMEVADATQPEVVVPMLSQEALRLRPGQPARLSGWGDRSGGASAVSGRVRLIEPAAMTKVSALGLEEQRVNVVIEPQQPLPPGDGYSVRVQVLMRQAEEALQVPVSAVFPLPGQPGRQAVFTIEGGRARLLPVSVWARGAGRAWVGPELRAEQPVVLFPPAALRDGARVRVVGGLSAPR